MEVADTRTKARTIVGLQIAEVEVVVEAGDEVVGEEKMEDLEVIKEYLAVSFRQEGEHRTHCPNMSRN
jgi:hypothetical protein